MKSRRLMLCAIFVILFGFQSIHVFADTNTPTKPAAVSSKPAHKDPNKEREDAWYIAISSLERARHELSNTSSNFGGTNRDLAIQYIDKSLAELHKVLK